MNRPATDTVPAGACPTCGHPPPPAPGDTPNDRTLYTLHLISLIGMDAARAFILCTTQPENT